METEKFPVVKEGRIGIDLVQTVNARDLHDFLEVGKDFSTWIKDRIKQYDFIENSDYVIFDSPNSGNQRTRGGDRRSKEYAITLDMGKELGMVERTEKGKEVRRYFIECEKAAKGGTALVEQEHFLPLDFLMDFQEKLLKSNHKDIDGMKAAVLHFIKHQIAVPAAHRLDYLKAFREATYERDKKLLRGQSESQRKLEIATNAINDILILAAPLAAGSAIVLDDWYSPRRIYEVFFNGRKMPNQRSLSNRVNASIGKYRRKFRMRAEEEIGSDIMWHIDVVRAWLADGGRDMIEDHWGKYLATEQGVLHFPNKKDK